MSIFYLCAEISSIHIKEYLLEYDAYLQSYIIVWLALAENFT